MFLLFTWKGMEMATVVRTRIVRIGNSQGIRVPKLLLEQVQLAEDQEVELELQADQIVIRPAHGARHGWDEAFRVMASQSDDSLLDEGTSTTEWDEEEWEW
jgi:antitoxin MazE